MGATTFLNRAMLNKLESQSNVSVLNLICLGAGSLDGTLGAAEADYSILTEQKVTP